MRYPSLATVGGLIITPFLFFAVQKLTGRGGAGDGAAPDGPAATAAVEAESTS